MHLQLLAHQVQVEVVNNIVRNCRDNYKDRFKYYLTGSYARNEVDFNDYDIAIYDNENDNKDWELLLKLFYNKNERDAKHVAGSKPGSITEIA